MAAKASQDPWGDFWALNLRSGSAATGEAGGCLPQRWAAIEAAQRIAWFDFVESLGKNARVLDLATGDGRVLRWVYSRRRDLGLTGIDLAPILPEAPAGAQTIGGIAMESLPFADNSYEAVVSQFGFEYGDPAKVSKEIARVLVDGGQIGLMMHRGDGPILAHNRQRRNELLWALKEKSVGKKVKGLLREGPIGFDKAVKLAGKIADLGAKKFGQHSPAWEIPEAIRRSCLMGRQSGAVSVIETISVIESHASNELARIQSLAGACQRADARKVIVDAFAAHGLTLKKTVAVCEPRGRELADFVTFG